MADGFHLVMSQGPQPGQTFMLDRDVLTLGRDSSNSIVINDPQVSRQHARITRQGGMMVIEDLGSTNGTYINGRRLTGPHVLTNGDAIGLGEVVTLTCYGEVQSGVTEAVAGRPATVPASSFAPSPAAAPPTPSYAPPPQVAPPPPLPAYAAAPPMAEAPVIDEGTGRTKRGVLFGCGCLVLLVIAACAAVFVLDYLTLLPTVFYEPLRWLGFI